MQAPPDGYTLLLGGRGRHVNASVTQDRPVFNPSARHWTRLQGIRFPGIACTSIGPGQNLPEFIAYAKANPARSARARRATRHSQHLTGELFKMVRPASTSSTCPIAAPGQRISDLIGGQVRMGMLV